MKPTKPTINKWEKRYQELKVYRNEHGDCLVPSTYKLNKQLATWVETQRRQWVFWVSGDHSHLNQERVDKLEAIGFAWNVFDKRNKRNWNKHLEELKEYKQLKGDCNVPRGYPPNKTLAQWVADQRRFYRILMKNKELEEEEEEEAGQEEARQGQGQGQQKKKKKKTPMTQERIDKLEAIGFAWDKTQDKHKQIWDGMIMELVQYKEKHGDCLVPFIYEDNKHLGFWVSRQRTQYNDYYQKGIKSTLTKEKVEQLDGLGFSWVTPEDQTISAQYKKKAAVTTTSTTTTAAAAPTTSTTTSNKRPRDTTTGSAVVEEEEESRKKKSIGRIKR